MMLDPKPPTPLESAVKLHQAGQIKQAAAAYRDILERGPDNPHALHLLGVTFIQTARLDEAARLIERAIALQPNIGTFHLNLASAYQCLRQVDDAIAEAEKAIALDPKLAAQGYHIAGLAFGDAGQMEDAAYCFEQAIAADPDSAESNFMLAIALDRLARLDARVPPFERARRLAQEWAAREPGSGPAHVLVARIQQQEGKLDEAVAEYRTATRLMPDDPTLFYSLGQVLQHQGKRDDALTCFQLALRLNPRYA